MTTQSRLSLALSIMRTPEGYCPRVSRTIILWHSTRQAADASTGPRREVGHMSRPTSERMIKGITEEQC